MYGEDRITRFSATTDTLNIAIWGVNACSKCWQRIMDVHFLLVKTEDCFSLNLVLFCVGRGWEEQHEII
jgi:hypothetical protein